MKKMNVNRIFDIVNYSLLILMAVIFLYPLYFTVIASVSEPVHVVQGDVVLWPKGFTLEPYSHIMERKDLWLGYWNSIVVTGLGTVLNLFYTIPAAYALSKKNMRFRGFFSTYFVIPMFISGGLLPFYITVKNLGLLNKPYSLILIGGVSIFNVVVTRTYFQSSIPESLYDAAKIDGCSDFGQFFRIALPLAKPIIAVIALYYAVGRWNDYFNAMIFLTEDEYYTLQLVLKNILLENQNKMTSLGGSMATAEELVYMAKRAYMAEAMKYAIIFIAALPMLIIYPFVQKYFVKGVMVGAVKG